MPDDKKPSSSKLTAVTGLSYVSKDGAPSLVPAGQKVPDGIFSKEQLERLKRLGAVE